MYVRSILKLRNLKVKCTNLDTAQFSIQGTPGSKGLPGAAGLPGTDGTDVSGLVT